MDLQLAYFTAWLELHGASGGEVHRFARRWRRSAAHVRLCPACFTNPRARGRAQVVELPRDEDQQVLVCSACDTVFDVPHMSPAVSSCGNALLAGDAMGPRAANSRQLHDVGRRLA